MINERINITEVLLMSLKVMAFTAHIQLEFSSREVALFACCSRPVTGTVVMGLLPKRSSVSSSTYKFRTLT